MRVTLRELNLKDVRIEDVGGLFLGIDNLHIPFDDTAHLRGFIHRLYDELAVIERARGERGLAA